MSLERTRLEPIRPIQGNTQGKSADPGFAVALDRTPERDRPDLAAQIGQVHTIRD